MGAALKYQVTVDNKQFWTGKREVSIEMIWIIIMYIQYQYHLRNYYVPGRYRETSNACYHGITRNLPSKTLLIFHSNQTGLVPYTIGISTN